MKKVLIAVLLMLAGFSQVNAQQAESFVAGKRISSQYAYGYGSVPGAHIALGNTATGTASVVVCPAVRALPDGRVVNLFTANSLAPIIFDRGTANQETVTPTAVSLVSPPPGFENDQLCGAITGTFSFTHGASTNVNQVASGTFGVQEAVNDAAPTGGIVVIDPTSGIQANLFGVMATVTPYPNVYLEDTTALGGYRIWKASANVTTTTSSAAAPTLTTGTGTLTSGQYFVKTAYIDVNGQISQASTESSQTATTTSITVSAPPASAGQVGYIIFLTAAGGSTNTETYYPLLNTNCKLTTVETVIPACQVTNTAYGQIGANALLTTNPATTTFKTMGATDTINRTAFAYTPSSPSAAFPVPNVQLSQAATGTAAATYQILGANFPPFAFGQVNRKYRLCFNGHDTFGGVAGQTLTFTLFYGAYNNSDSTLLSLASAAGTATAGTQVVHSCIDLDITANAGTSISILPHGWMDVNLANSNVTSRVQDQTSAAVSGLSIVGNQQIRLQLVVGAQALAAGFVLDDLSFEALD